MSHELSVEYLARIYDDTTGDYIQVSPDADALGLVELIQFEGGKERTRMTMPPKQASLLAHAIGKCITDNGDLK